MCLCSWWLAYADDSLAKLWYVGWSFNNSFVNRCPASKPTKHTNYRSSNTGKHCRVHLSSKGAQTTSTAINNRPDQPTNEFERELDFHSLQVSSPTHLINYTSLAKHLPWSSGYQVATVCSRLAILHMLHEILQSPMYATAYRGREQPGIFL